MNAVFIMSNRKRNVVVLKQGNRLAKTCAICGKRIEFTRRTAREWEKVEYCSAVCRRRRGLPEEMPAAG